MHTNALEALVDPMRPVACTVAARRRETHDTVTLELALPGGVTYPFEPGQFNMLYAYGTGESAISIAGDPDRPGRLVHTIRDVGAVTRHLTAARKGDIIGVRGPFGQGWPVAAARQRDLVIVAGGIGLAPLRPVVLAALNHRSDFGRVVLLIGTRTPSDLLYRREIEHWRARLDVQVEVTVDRAESGWFGDVGVVTTLFGRASFDPARTTAMLCGPEIMMRYAARELAARGVGAENVFVTLERNMKCAIGFCGHCQLGGRFLCKDGPVFRLSELAGDLEVKEL